MSQAQQPDVRLPSPELLRKLQLQTEGGAILCSNYAGGYELLTEIYQVVAQELEAKTRTKPEIKQTMTEIQFDAMVRLKGLCANKPTCKAAKDVFTNGMSMYAATRKHGANEPSVQSTCKSIRAALRDCYIVITGEVPGEGAQG